MARVSLAEQYDDKDVIKQIYLLWDAIDQGAVKDLDIVREGGQVKITVTFHDDEVKEFTLEDDEIQNVTQSQSGSQVTITIVMKSGTTYPFTFTAATGVTLDTDQTVTGMKVFSAASTKFSHDVDVGADLNVGGTVEANELTVDTDAVVDGNLAVGGNASITGHVTGNVTIEGDLDVGNLAIEASSQKTMLSNANGIETASDTPVSFGRTPKLGTSTIGSTNTPVFLDSGNPTACNAVAKTDSSNTFSAIQTVNSTSSSSNGQMNLVAPGGGFSRLIMKNDTSIASVTWTGESLNLFPVTTSSSPSGSFVTKGYMESTDASNNLVHTIGNENILGLKDFERLTIKGQQIVTYSGSARWRKIFTWSGYLVAKIRVLSYRSGINEFVVYGQSSRYLNWGADHASDADLNPLIIQEDDESYSLWVRIRISDTTRIGIEGNYYGNPSVSTDSSSAKPEGNIIAELEGA